MKILYNILWLMSSLSMMTVLFSCGENIDEIDKDAPAKPKLIARNADTAFVEAGIDAVPDGNYIYLEWEPNNEIDLKGYIVERKDPDSTSFLQVSELIDKKQNSFTDNDPGLLIRKKYTYRVCALDETGNRSDYSFEHSYELLDKVMILSFKRFGTDSLAIECSNIDDTGNYLIFRFYHDQQVVYVMEYPELTLYSNKTYYFDYQQYGFDLDRLKVRVDAVDGNSAGSESNIKALSKN